MSHASTEPRIRHGLPTEYWLYFVPIFLTALPAGLVQWSLGVRRPGTNPGPVRRAMTTAHCITPQIFSA